MSVVDRNKIRLIGVACSTPPVIIRGLQIRSIWRAVTSARSSGTTAHAESSVITQCMMMLAAQASAP